MSEAVIVRSNGFFFRHEEKGILVEDEITNKNFVICLRYQVEVDEDVTLRNLLTNVLRHSEIADFTSRYSHCRLKEYVSLLELPKAESKNIDYLELYWHGEWYDGGKYNLNDFQYYWGFHGIGKRRNEYWAIGANHNEIIDLPIRVNSNGHVVCSRDNGQMENTFEREIDISFLSFLDTIFYEISFYGSPSDAKTFFDEMEERAEECERKGEKGIPFEEVMEHLNKMSELRRLIDIHFDDYDDFPTLQNEIFTQDLLKGLDDENMSDLNKHWLYRKIKKAEQAISQGEVNTLTDLCSFIKGDA